MESILASISKLIGNGENSDYYDPDLIIHINSVLSELNQIGIGPEEGFIITDNTATWNDFIGDTKIIEMVKTFVYLKVKLIFDPPLSSSVLDAMERQISKLEWRLSVALEGGNQNGGN